MVVHGAVEIAKHRGSYTPLSALALEDDQITGLSEVSVDTIVSHVSGDLHLIAEALIQSADELLKGARVNLREVLGHPNASEHFGPAACQSGCFALLLIPDFRCGLFLRPFEFG